MRLRLWLVWMALLLCSHGAWAAVNLAGVRYEDSIDFHGHKLVLNGAGIRYKFVVKVYAAALYVTRPGHTPEEVYSAPGPKHVVLTMLRDVDANELAKLFIRGIEDNAPKASFTRWLPGLLKMGEVFGSLREFHAGDVIEVDWVPGTGTVFLVRGKVLSIPSEEPDFYSAGLSVWLGKNPADYRLKDALLGIQQVKQ